MAKVNSALIEINIGMLCELRVELQKKINSAERVIRESKGSLSKEIARQVLGKSLSEYRELQSNVDKAIKSIELVNGLKGERKC